MMHYRKSCIDSLTPQLGQVCAPSFSRVVLNCQRIFNVPVAAIGLREHRHLRLYFAGGSQQRLLMDDALCGLPLTIPAEQIQIQDLQQVPEDLQPPLALALGVRSYVGVPIFVGKQLLGSLNIADHQPRHFEAREVQRLRDLAVWTGALLELHL